jgi:ABC-type sugar transport system permease subunit
MNRSGTSVADRRLAVLLIAPALVIVLGVTLAPVGATAWEAMHQHDLRLPWLGMPFIGLANFSDAFTDPRFGATVLRTTSFAALSVPLELALGLAFALVMHRIPQARGLARVTTLLPFTIPTVVAALIWRFIAESIDQGTASDWFAGRATAWVPIIFADVWKTTPFVALLLLAGLQAIDEELYDAARMDGARPLRQLMTITIPLLAPALVVAAAFRTLDALRLFDLPYVMTGGGPGTATEPVSLYAFIVLMQRLQFGYGSALSLMVFGFALLVALAAVRVLGRVSVHEQRS